MRRRLTLLALTLTLAAAAPADAITNGVPDAGHPAAGATVMQSFTWPAEDGGPLFQLQQCSGVLVAPRVFLTAAHCTDFFRYASFFDGFGVTFAPVAPFGAFDQAADGLLHGTVVQDPQFSTSCPITTCHTADPHDLAAVILDQPVAATPALLPRAGKLDALAARNRLRRSSFAIVGYGSTGDEPGGGRPVPNAGRGVKRVASASYMALSPGVLRLSQNAATGAGGACDGDSGGPVYLGTSSKVVALTITGDQDAACTATNVAYRLDTPSARQFLSTPAIAAHLQLP
jgi:hypothetical protein